MVNIVYIREMFICTQNALRHLVWGRYTNGETFDNLHMWKPIGSGNERKKERKTKLYLQN